MAEYIDREAAVSSIRDSVLNKAKEEQIGPMTVLAVAQGAVNKLPAADVEPVRHAKFVHFSDVWGTCSNCGEILFDEERKFCPNCGAKMDASGGEQNEPSENK